MMGAATPGVEAARLVDVARIAQEQYEAGTPIGRRKSCGQVFTPASVCHFMAKLLGDLPDHLRLLDPGAGVGSLTAAVCERYLSQRSRRVLRVDLFESDALVVGLLEWVMESCRSAMEAAGHAMEYRIHARDFILTFADSLSQDASLFPAEPLLDAVDAVVMNPPYFKVRADSAHAHAMREVTHGQPNMYIYFMAVSARLLQSGGQLIGITPRSFCNGPYFREFRQWFMSRMSLERAHLMESRTDTFNEASVLQESMITRWRRADVQSPRLTVTRSYGRDFSSVEEQSLPANSVLKLEGRNCLIRLPERENDVVILAEFDCWPLRFADLGLRASTGPVVMFRAKEFLLDHVDRENAVPLLSAHNVRPFKTRWPVRKGKWPLAFVDCPESRPLLVPTRNYILLKRFSAKEERRRLTAGCFLATDHTCQRIAFENHLNYLYHVERELTCEEVFGIAAIFNSLLFDRYFRAISGHTQVNASEIRSMPFPSWDVVRSIGRRVCSLQSAVGNEEIVTQELQICNSTVQYLRELSQ